MKVYVETNVLHIEVDIGTDAIAAATPSSTGKSKIVETTRGFRHVEEIDGLSFSLNVITK
jgi:hypothetical protein